ncbi:hypothetical protein ABK040_004294 [Willaertia magna]
MLRVQLRYFRFITRIEARFFFNLYSVGCAFSDISFNVRGEKTDGKQEQKQGYMHLNGVFYIEIPIHLNEFPCNDENMRGRDTLNLNREQRMMWDNPLFSFMISSILLDMKVTKIRNLIPINTLLNENIFVVNLPHFMSFNPQIAELPGSLLTYLHGLKCLPNNNYSIGNQNSNNNTLYTRCVGREKGKVDTSNFPVMTSSSLEIRKTVLSPVIVPEDPIFNSLKEKLLGIILKDNMKIEVPDSLQQFSFPQVVKRQQQKLSEEWFLKVNLLNLYLKLITPSSLILDFSSTELIKRFYNILQIQMKGSLLYSNYFISSSLRGRQPEPSWTEERYNSFMKDRKDCFERLQQEFKGELYHLITLAKCLEFQDNVCLLTGHPSTLKYRLKFIALSESNVVKDDSIMELIDLRIREYLKTKEFVERELCKLKIEKFLFHTKSSTKKTSLEKEIIEIVKQHYTGLSIITREDKVYPTVFNNLFIMDYRKYFEEQVGIIIN